MRVKGLTPTDENLATESLHSQVIISFIVYPPHRSIITGDWSTLSISSREAFRLVVNLATSKHLNYFARFSDVNNVREATFRKQMPLAHSNQLAQRRGV